MVKLALRTPQKRKKYRPPANRKKTQKKHPKKTQGSKTDPVALCGLHNQLNSPLHVHASDET